MKFDDLLPLPGPGSRLCAARDFRDPWYGYWTALCKEPPRYHRKQWEFVFICNALARHGMLDRGKSGLGFGVGHEPLPSLFASLGCSILATDQAAEQAGAWAKTNQHISSLVGLNERGICLPLDFADRVVFQPVDMNAIPALSNFDFCWSACAFEHLGTLQNGLDFVQKAMATLKPGGIAVHTTEFNLSSNEETLGEGGTVLYRRQDINALATWLTEAGHTVEALDFDAGQHELDEYVDVPPYHSSPHLKLKIEAYTCTSIGIVIQKAKE